MAIPNTNSGDKQDAPAHIEPTVVDHEVKHEKAEIVTAQVEGADSTPDPFAHLDIKKIHRKMDARIVPMLTVLYLLSFLDRGNIGRPFSASPSVIGHDF